MPMPNNGYFDIKRDTEIISTDGFFCRACAVGKPAAEISPDPRYCQGCYDFLLEEAKMITGHPRWVPNQSCKAPQSKLSSLKVVKVSPYPNQNMSTLQDGKIEVDIIQPPTLTRTFIRDDGKRGPKRKPLPEDLIKQWASEGMGSKAIVARLKSELGIDISYKTIQRLLSGQRILVNV